MTITTLPTPPSRSGAPSSFGARFPPFLAAMPTFRSELESEFGAKTTIALAGLTGFAFSGIASGVKKLVMRVRIVESASLRRGFRLRFGAAAGLAAGSAYQGVFVKFLSTSLDVSTMGNSFTLLDETAPDYYLILTLIRCGTNRYLFEGIARTPAGALYYQTGRLVLSAPVSQLVFDNTTTATLSIPHASGTAELAWSF